MQEQIIQGIRQSHRFRQDLLSAEVSLSNRIESVYRRLTGMKIEKRRAYERKHKKELEMLRGGEGGHISVEDNQAFVAPVPTPEQAAVGQDNIEQGPVSRAYPAALNSDDQDDDDEGTQLEPQQYIAALDKAAMVTVPMVEGRTIIKQQRLWYDKQIEAMAKELPIWPWVESCRGVSALSLGLIVGECGNLSNYPTKGTLWKRMGLAVIHGERQRKVANDKALAIEHGYNPRRRALAYLLADNLIRARNPEYYDWYIEEKDRQREKLGEDAPQIHVHRRAHRHLSKRFLKHLWQQWRAVERGQWPNDIHTSSAPIPPAVAAD